MDYDGTVVAYIYLVIWFFLVSEASVMQKDRLLIFCNFMAVQLKTGKLMSG